MRTRNRRSKYLLLSSAAAATAALVVGGCGGSDSDSTNSKKNGNTQQLGSNPADVLPADTKMYMEATVKPQGEQKEAAQTAAQKLFGDVNIAEYIAKEASDGDSKGEEINYSKDIDPWLGSRAGLFLGSFENEDGFEAGIIISLTDAKKAAAFNEEEFTGKEYKDRTYKGVDYRIDTTDDSAVAIYKDTTIIGTENALKAIVDAGDKTLSKDKDYQETVNTLQDSPLGTFYTSKELGNEIKKSTLAEDGLFGSGLAPAFTGQANDPFLAAMEVLSKPTISSLTADADKLQAEFLGEVEGEDFVPTDKDALGNLPADSWMAVAMGFDGKNYYEKTLLPSLPPAEKQQLDQVATQLGIDLNEDLFAWMKGVEFYIAGTSIETLNGAMMINTSDSAKSKALVEKLRTTFGPLAATGAFTIEEIKDGFSVTSKELPAPIQIGVRNDRMIIAYGKDGLDKATSADKKLADDTTFKASQDAIDGLIPSYYIAFAPITEAVGNFAKELDADDKELAQAKSILGKFTYLMLGAGNEGEKVKNSVALGLK